MRSLINQAQAWQTQGFYPRLKGTDNRLKAIRNLAASALPGKAIVVLESQSKLVTDIVLAC